MIEIEEIKAQVRADQYVYTLQAEVERRAHNPTFAQIEDALLNGEILERTFSKNRGCGRSPTEPRGRAPSDNVGRVAMPAAW